MYSIYQSVRDTLPKWRGAASRYLLFRSDRIQIGENFRCDGIPDITVREGCRLIIGDNVVFRRNIEIRATGASTIIIGDGVKLDRGIRVLAANDSTVDIGAKSAIGLYTVLSGGSSITIGEYGLISGFVYLQGSMHQHEAGTPVKLQGFDHAPVVLERDVWLGAHSVIMPGVTLHEGTVVGSNAVVTKSVPANTIVAGVPAKPLRER